MADIRDYINISNTASEIVDHFVLPDDFKEKYYQISGSEKKSVVRHFIVNNIPFAFRERPILYEQISQYLADKLEVTPTEVKLIGSAKTGFSISPPPDYGRQFGTHSDLDFSVINEDLFYQLNEEFNSWKDQYQDKVMVPSNDTEARYWSQNVETGNRQLKRGFLDSHYIPNRDEFELTRKLNNSMFLVKKYLSDIHKIEITKATISVYQDWHSFAKRLNINTESVMEKL